MGFARALGPLPDTATVKAANRGARDVTLWFTRSRRGLERGIDKMATAVGDTRLWPAIIRSGTCAGLGSPPASSIFKFCAVDQEWSGLAFVRRKRK